MIGTQLAGEGGGAAHADERDLIQALRAGDEAAFVGLVNQYYAPMLRLAMVYVSRRAIAEEVFQETWLGVFQGLHRFEGRSSLKTWIFHILTNRAKTRAQREGRTIPFSSLRTPESDSAEPTVDPGQFWPDDHPQWANVWVSYPRRLEGLPDDQTLSKELRSQIDQVIATLPASQREVITLRDIESWSAEEVCTLLELSEANQRVLLHRARAKVRRSLEIYLNGE
jgi:RNA polymerase sigma-70 factor (ECF subfamily)